LVYTLAQADDQRTEPSVDPISEFDRERGIATR
jgi:hypothetical protein